MQPDGTITLRLLGQVHATGCTVPQLRDALDELYKKYYKVPAITVTPLKVNTKLEDLRAARSTAGPASAARARPSASRPRERSPCRPLARSSARGCRSPNCKKKSTSATARWWRECRSSPILVQRAPRYVYVLGEVNSPGRFELVAPTTALQAIGLAGSWRVGANLRQIVVFRRGDDWRLLATMIELGSRLVGPPGQPPGEIWIDDSDVMIVPKSTILMADDFIDLVFTRGIYGVFPMYTTLSFTKLSTL